MRFFDYFSLGLRNIWRRKSRSFLTVFAVAIGAISMVIMLSLVLGAKQIASQQLESIDGLTLVSVSPSSEIQSNRNLLSADFGGEDITKKLNDSTVAILRGIPGVIDATPTIGVWIKSCKLEGQDKKFRGNLLAFTPGTRVLKIPVAVGRELQPGDMDKIVIGTETLRNFGFAGRPLDIIGKKVVLYVQNYIDWGPVPPRPPENPDEKYWESMQRESHNFTAEIIGVVTSGPDESQNYITLEWGKRLNTGLYWKEDGEKRKAFEENRKATEGGLQANFSEEKKQLEEKLRYQRMEDYERSWYFQKLEAQFKQASEDMIASVVYNSSDFMVLFKEDGFLRSGYGAILLRVDSTDKIESVGKAVLAMELGVTTAKGMLDEIKKIFGLVGLIVGAIGGIVLFVAALGIINSMIMATYERTREIGILRACGATRASIKNMFLFEAATLGLLGGAIGIAISYGLAKLLNLVGNNIAASYSVPISNLMTFPLWLVIGVLALTTLIGIISGLLPAIRASHLDPVEALRYE